MATVGSGFFYGVEDHLPAYAFALVGLVDADAFDQCSGAALVGHVGDDGELQETGPLAVALDEDQLISWVGGNGFERGVVGIGQRICVAFTERTQRVVGQDVHDVGDVVSRSLSE